MKLDIQLLFVFLVTALALLGAVASFVLILLRRRYGRTFVVVSLGCIFFVWPPSFFATSIYNLERSKSTQFCASCHDMEQHVEDVMGATSKSLAAKHVRRTWINKNACYTCHTDYTMFGPLNAKFKGMRHMMAALLHDVKEEEIDLYHPYQDRDCLQCHDQARFDRVEEHIDADADERCIDCHDNMHKVRRIDE
jgi:cytochrome c-type protein NapC